MRNCRKIGCDGVLTWSKIDESHCLLLQYLRWPYVHWIWITPRCNAITEMALYEFIIQCLQSVGATFVTWPMHLYHMKSFYIQNWMGWWNFMSVSTVTPENYVRSLKEMTNHLTNRWGMNGNFFVCWMKKHKVLKGLINNLLSVHNSSSELSSAWSLDIIVTESEQ